MGNTVKDRRIRSTKLLHRYAAGHMHELKTGSRLLYTEWSRRTPES